VLNLLAQSIQWFLGGSADLGPSNKTTWKYEGAGDFQAGRLLKEGIRARVVSMPSWDIFEHQTQEYRASVLLPSLKVRLAVEQASYKNQDPYSAGASRRR
jgi:transketolase